MVLSGKVQVGLLLLSTRVYSESLADVPDIVADMPSVQRPVSEKFNEEGIAKLTASAGKLLQTTKAGNLVTPVVAEFAHKTIQEIEEVIATIEDEHKVAVQDLENVYARFTNAAPGLEANVDGVSLMKTQVSQRSSAHVVCRQLQAPLMEAEQSCRKAEEHDKVAYEADEAVLTETYHSIKGRWCPNEYNEEDEEFFASNENDMTMYMEQKATVKQSEQKYVDTKKRCDAAQQEREVKQAECDAAQESLEFAACEYGITASSANQHLHTTWNELEAEYTQVTRDVTADAEDRHKEFIGVTIVKCLLQKIEENQLAGMPCNETHADEVNAGITNCHNQDINVDHLQIDPKSAPNSPAEAAQPHVPCDDLFVAENYATLATEVLTGVLQKCNPCA